MSRKPEKNQPRVDLDHELELPARRLGVFTMREGSDARIVLVGGGAGMAPILALLRALAERESARDIVFYYGARTERDLCFEDELHELERTLPSFRYVPALSEPDEELGRRDRLDHRRLKKTRRDLTGAHAYVCGPPPMVEAAMAVLEAPRRASTSASTTTSSPPPEILISRGAEARRTMREMTTTRPQERRRSVPKPDFTDAEAGAKVFPDSTARHYNYFTPQKRKQSHYEDVTVEVQPDPRHYLSQGWLYGFSDGRGGYPLDWTALKAWGSTGRNRSGSPARAARATTGRRTAGTSSATPTRSGSSPSTATTPTSSGRSTRTSTPPGRPRRSSSGTPTGCGSSGTNVGAWMHVEHGLGLYVFANANRRAPTNMHNNAISVNSMHRIRFAQDLALYNLTLSEEVPGFDGAAHIETWNDDPDWQGVREVAEQLTAIDDWCEAIFATNVVFEPLVGELFRSHLVQHAAPHNGDFVTPTVVGAGEYDYAQRDLRYTRVMFELLTTDKEFADHNKETDGPVAVHLDPALHRRRPQAAAALVAVRRQAAALRGRHGHGARAASAASSSDLDLHTRRSSPSDRRPVDQTYTTPRARSSPTTPPRTGAA